MYNVISYQMLMLFKFLKISCSLLNIRGADYYYIINENSKHDAVNLQKNADLTVKGVLQR